MQGRCGYRRATVICAFLLLAGACRMITCVVRCCVSLSARCLVMIARALSQRWHLAIACQWRGVREHGARQTGKHAIQVCTQTSLAATAARLSRVTSRLVLFPSHVTEHPRERNYTRDAHKYVHVYGTTPLHVCQTCPGGTRPCLPCWKSNSDGHIFSKFFPFLSANVRKEIHTEQHVCHTASAVHYN